MCLQVDSAKLRLPFETKFQIQNILLHTLGHFDTKVILNMKSTHKLRLKSLRF